MNRTSPALAPAQDEEDLFALSTIDWELGVVDRNCRKLLRVLAGIEETYAGTSTETPAGRAQLKKQLDGLQLEKADFRERREVLVLKLSQQPAYAAALAADIRIEDGQEENALLDENVGRTAPGVGFLRFPSTGGDEEDIINLPEPSAPYSTVLGAGMPPSGTVAELSTPSAARVVQVAPISSGAGDGTPGDSNLGSAPASPSSPPPPSSSMAAEVPAAADAATAAVEVAGETVSPPEVDGPTGISLAVGDQRHWPSSSLSPATPLGKAAIAAEAEAEAEGVAMDSLCDPAPTVEELSAKFLAPNLAHSCSASSTLAPSSFFGGGAVQDACKPASHEVQVRATVGARGLGLILAEEQEESRWVVKGFRPMPGGKPNPGQVAGIKAGDALQQLGGVHLGSYKDGIELLEQQRGPIYITVRRQTF